MLDRPEAANGMQNVLRQVFEFVIDYGLHDRNPTRLVKNIKTNSAGHIAWSDEDINAFITVHSPSTTVYLALKYAFELC